MSTVTSVPSDFFRWASYSASPESVSTRITVAPGTAASAAAFALAASSPVSNVSPGPFGIVAGSCAPAGAVVERDPEPPVAAPASPAAPTASPVATAAVMIHDRLLRAGDGSAPASMGSIEHLLGWIPGVSRADHAASRASDRPEIRARHVRDPRPGATH